MKEIVVCLPSYSICKQINTDGKWVTNFTTTLPIDKENIIPCQSVCVSTHGGNQLIVSNDLVLETFVSGGEICFPNNLTVSGDLALVLQDICRHPNLYTDITVLNDNISFGFSSSFGLTIHVTNVAVIINETNKVQCGIGHLVTIFWAVENFRRMFGSITQIRV